MFGIDDPTAVAVMPTPEAAGTPGFWTEGNPALGQAATYVRASFLNGLQSELLNILTAAGITPSKTTYNQLLKSVQVFLQANGMQYVADTGTANTYVVAYAPAVAALTDGMVLWFKAKTANTGASTIAVNGLTAVPVVGGAHAALQGGEIVANGRCMVIYNATLSSFVLIECTGAALQVAPATQSGHALQQGQKGYARLTASGSVVVPPGVTTMYLSATAPGGGGGGGGGGGVSSFVGGGGGGGACGQNLVRSPVTVVPGQTLTVTIGSVGGGGAGSAGVGSAGTAGGSVTITNVNGGTLTLLGGNPGQGGANATGQTSGGAGGLATNSSQANGGYGSDTTNQNASGNGGTGASGPYGSGGAGGPGRSSGGFAATSPGGFGAGGGGGGGLYNGTAASGTGGNGSSGGPGLVILEW